MLRTAKSVIIASLMLASVQSSGDPGREGGSKYLTPGIDTAIALGRMFAQRWLTTTKKESPPVPASSPRPNHIEKAGAKFTDRSRSSNEGAAEPAEAQTLRAIQKKEVTDNYGYN